MFTSIISELDSGILTITINRPDKLNALNVTVLEELHSALVEAAAQPECRSILITGAGPKAFVAGADISEFPHFDRDNGLKLAQQGQEKVFSYLEQFTKPVVAAINGFALGGGCELAMACHLRVAATHARFGQPEVNLGLIPGYGGTQRMVQLIGKGRAMELLLTGNFISAEQALQYGLVNQVTSAEDLLPTAKALLQSIMQKAPLAIASCIKLVNMATYEPAKGLDAEAEMFGDLFTSADVKEGVDAFLQKRPAHFTGK